MMAAPAVLAFSERAADNAHIAGPLIVSFSIISMWECTRNVRLLNLPVALWLMAAPIIFRYHNDTVLMNFYLVSVAVILLSLVKPVRRHRFAGGWLSLFRQRPSAKQ